MAVKTLTITEEAYNQLKLLKENYESFSEFFLRLAGEKTNQAERFLGAAKLSEGELQLWREQRIKAKQDFINTSKKKQQRLEKRIQELGL